MAGLGLAISQRLFPMPLQWGRFAATAAAALASYAVSTLAPAGLGAALAVKLAAFAGFAVPAALLTRKSGLAEIRAASGAGTASPPG
jgi:hypothetical protein